MNKQLTEMVLILDRSGSMHGLEADTIGGFNSTIEKQKKVDTEPQSAALPLCYFLHLIWYSRSESNRHYRLERPVS